MPPHCLQRLSKRKLGWRLSCNGASVALYVQKFGGTSVGSLERIEAVADRVACAVRAGDAIVVVLSAMAGETNRLVALAHQVNADPEPREFDLLISTGEQISIALMAMALHKRGISAQALLGDQAQIVTDGRFGKARIEAVRINKLQQLLQQGIVPIVAGFQGRCQAGELTTLGRGGSDTTAVAIAAALKADECQIYTDVDGVYTTDPRVEPNARKMESITFAQMMELSTLGAKVLQDRSVEYAGRYQVPLRVLSSLDLGAGTLITYEKNCSDRCSVVGIAFHRDEASLTLVGIPDNDRVMAQVLTPLHKVGIATDMTQQYSTQVGKANLVLMLHRSDVSQARVLLTPVMQQLGAVQLQEDPHICKVSVVGTNLQQAHMSNEVQQRLLNEGIDVQFMAASEIKISVAMDEKYMELAVRSLHQAFNLDAAS